MSQFELARYPQTYHPQRNQRSLVLVHLQTSPHQQNRRTPVKMGRQCAARWNIVHGGLRVADPSHPIQLVNQTQAILIAT